MARHLGCFLRFGRFYLRQWYVYGIGLATLVLIIAPRSVDAKIAGIALAIVSSVVAALVLFKKECHREMIEVSSTEITPPEGRRQK